MNWSGQVTSFELNYKCEELQELQLITIGRRIIIEAIENYSTERRERERE